MAQGVGHVGPVGCDGERDPHHPTLGVDDRRPGVTRLQAGGQEEDVPLGALES